MYPFCKMRGCELEVFWAACAVDEARFELGAEVYTTNGIHLCSNIAVRRRDVCKLLRSAACGVCHGKKPKGVLYVSEFACGDTCKQIRFRLLHEKSAH